VLFWIDHASAFGVSLLVRRGILDKLQGTVLGIILFDCCLWRSLRRGRWAPEELATTRRGWSKPPCVAQLESAIKTTFNAFALRACAGARNIDSKS